MMTIMIASAPNILYIDNLTEL